MCYFFFNAVCSVLPSFHTVHCVSLLFHNARVLWNTSHSTLCVVSILFVPCSVCYVLPLPHGIKVPHSTNLHSILCAVCAFTPYSMPCVLFLLHATCVMHYIIVLHGMCTICYFSCMLGLPCIIFIPCYVCWAVILRCVIPVVCLNYKVT